MPTYYAHSVEGEDERCWQTLSDHLKGVANLASSYATRLGLPSWGTLVGAYHDYGKASPQFQRRLKGSPEQVDHATAGAIKVGEAYSEIGVLASYCIAGHHSGLPDGFSLGGGSKRKSLAERLEEKELLAAVDAAGIEDFIEDEGVSQDALLCELSEYLGKNHLLKPAMQETDFRLFVFGHFLYSCLVDADYLDTERFLSPNLSDARDAQHDDINGLLEKYQHYMSRLEDGADSSLINRCRLSIKGQCISAAEYDPGIFTLSVPTGGGKTLSAMAFALEHAKHHGQDRIIVALPFTNLIEQTADVFRHVFGDENVLEHHSNFDFEELGEDDALRARLATQNWDAPIIVTTNVQLFESLFSNRPGKSRKVHNIANSVLVLDEAQTLPDYLLKATLVYLEELAFCQGDTVVLCTATQPYFDKVWPFGSKPKEIIEDRDGFEEAFAARTIFDDLGALELDVLCKRLCEEEQVLCVVGKRSEALEIYKRLLDLDDDRVATFYLSTYMTPAHRSEVISEIKKLLARGEKCRVVSTQLIEAGVDIDFPVVYRELAGIDSLYQAAGRCNREGKRCQESPVYIFECLGEDGERIKTTKWLEAMKDYSRVVIEEHGGKLDSGCIEDFFKLRYASKELLDASGAYGFVTRNVNPGDVFESIPFASAAEAYQFIEDATEPVFVLWGEGANRLFEKMRTSENPAVLARAAQRFSIGLRPDEIAALEKKNAFEELGPFKILRACDGCRVFYNEYVGFNPEGEELLPLVV